MKLIIDLRFNFLAFHTPCSFVLGHITIRKTTIINDQELPKITSFE